MKLKKLTFQTHKIDETYVTEAVKKYLSPKWSVIKERGLNEKGCDLILRDEENKNKARRFYIECKGKSYSSSARSVNETSWLYCLGQLITRMTVIAPYAYKYGIGLPKVSADIALRRIPYQAAGLLKLHIFSVDDYGKVTEYKPSDIKTHQISNNLTIKR